MIVSGGLTSASAVRVAIIGAGPIGLEAALKASRAGLDTAVYERGRTAESVRDWGHVQLFSPFGLNSSTRGREAVGSSLPGDGALLTGDEFVESYLEPLAAVVAGSAEIHERSSVVAVSRESTWKHQLVGRRREATDRFRLLIETPGGETTDSADIVLDCSGTWGNHRWIGAGGMPCPGERTLLGGEDYRIPNLEGSDRERFADQHTVVVGSGHSAATSVVALAEMATRFSSTRLTWITLAGGATPLEPVVDDPLPARAELVAAANRLAVETGSVVDWCPGCLVLGLDGQPGQLSMEVDEPSRGRRVIQAGRILGQVGFRPDRSVYEELQVQECYATAGPIRLAASLLGETSTDCLAQGGGDLATLQSPEPDFYIVGSKSYGRDARFLIRVGLEQVELVLDHVIDTHAGVTA
ncbi:MAG: NAD(P)-binding domain-containing protein [Planctomycetaceae bacterium]|nr:NAD(P)-binding domain-containing protein [Planctomycetaceae bacterium]